MKKIAILQSNYIPWKGYFDLINMVDEFILYDTSQYTKNDWRNRNKIKSANGVSWLTIPVKQEHLNQRISDTVIASNNWAIKHWKTISQTYAKAKFFKIYSQPFKAYYLNTVDHSLSQINFELIKIINEILGIKTKIHWSSNFNLTGGQTENILSICEQLKAGIYLSGPSAKNYFNEQLAKEKAIKVEWMDYSDYPQYKQLHSPFEHSVTILDLIFNEGPNATTFMKSFKNVDKLQSASLHQQ
ncbi:WbqC family protein [Vreelandella populi]|uniref:WbqC family protein n=1 Tax=Vreelandella populi TaxID=2498858 RepID=UPI000F8E27A0|nr:WbqC family protein [Halomonas populi]RUR56549.1 hypothetical protein ELY40_02820 [Halomonas populi]